jgi:hypothetical protein
MSAFGVANAVDFSGADPASVKATALFAELGTVITGLSGSTSGQVSGSGASRAGTTSKSSLRTGLNLTMRGIRKSAEGIAASQKNPAVLDNFRLSETTNDLTLAANATAFANAATPLSASFIELGHATTFVQDLKDQVTAFSAADESQSVGGQARSGATASIAPLMHEGLAVRKQLDAWAGNKYSTNAAKIGAWTTAAHIEHISHAAKAPAPAAAKAA